MSHEGAVDLVLRRALTGEPGAYVCLTNVHTTVASQESADLRSACDSAFLSVPDGMPLVWLLRRRGWRHVEKVTGIEFMPRVAAAGIDVGLRHFFVGGSDGVVEAAARGLQSMVPGTVVVGAHALPFGPPESWDLEPIRAALRASQPHVLWVGLGAPKQELWMAQVAGSLDAPVMIGVGAAFDFLAGTKRPAPRILSRLGLEWLFRLASEPRRLWRRYLMGNSTFLWLLARDRFPGSSKRRALHTEEPHAAGDEVRA